LLWNVNSTLWCCWNISTAECIKHNMSILISWMHDTNIINLNIFYCLNNDKRIRHKFFNLVLSFPYTYNIQYTIW
jgi:hypothetical protein